MERRLFASASQAGEKSCLVQLVYSVFARRGVARADNVHREAVRGNHRQLEGGDFGGNSNSRLTRDGGWVCCEHRGDSPASGLLVSFSASKFPLFLHLTNVATLQDAYSDDRFKSMAAYQLPGVSLSVSMLCAPVKVRGSVCAVVQITGESPFSADDEESILLFNQQVRNSEVFLPLLNALNSHNARFLHRAKGSELCER